MDLRRLDVGQGALAWFVAGSLVMASACSSDSNVDFDPTPSSGGDASSGGTKPSSSGSGSGATQSGGSSNGNAGASDGGTGNSAGSSASAGTNSGGKSQGGNAGSNGNAGATNDGGKAGTSNAGSGGSGNGGSAGSAGNGGSAGTAGSGGSGTGNDCVAATFGGHSYYFCGVVDSAPAAYAKCQSLGMKMVEIETMAEQTFVIGKQKGQSWLGGTDELKEGEWRWASTTQVFWDGEPRGDFGSNDGRVDGVYSNFIVGQPNNMNVDGFPENCLAINANGWNDLYCNLPDVRAACEGTGPIILPKP